MKVTHFWLINGEKTVMTAQDVFDFAFSQPRDPRSEAYKQGVLSCLRRRIDGLPDCKNPYSLGTAEADAWWAGIDEGLMIVRELIRKSKERMSNLEAL